MDMKFFNAEQFLDDLDFCDLCKKCPYAEGQGAYCSFDFHPSDANCLCHDIYEAIRERVQELENAFKAVQLDDDFLFPYESGLTKTRKFLNLI